jgi:hypothetical protein
MKLPSMAKSIRQEARAAPLQRRSGTNSGPGEVPYNQIDTTPESTAPILLQKRYLLCEPEIGLPDDPANGLAGFKRILSPPAVPLAGFCLS